MLSSQLGSWTVSLMAWSVGASDVFEAFLVEPLRQSHKPFRSQYRKDLHTVARLVEENEKHRVEHRHLDIEFDQCGQAIDGFSKVDRLGVEVHFFDFGVRSHHVGELQKKSGAQHQGSGKRFGCGVHGALTLLLHHLQRFQCRACPHRGIYTK